METNTQQAANLRNAWETDQRWNGIERDYTAQDVIRLRESVTGEHTLARRGASRLWDLLQREAVVGALGAGADNQAAAAASAGPQAIYLPDGPADSAALAVQQVSRALLRADQPAAPVVAGCGGALDAFELMKSMIAAGAAGVHFEDQLSAETNPGRKILIPTGQHINTLTAARLAADVCDVPSLVIARTAAHAASLLASDADERDHEFLTGERTAEGYYRVRPGLYACVTRALAFAPYADLLWLEAATPDLAEARAFANIIHSQYPDQLLAYNWSPSSDWRPRLDNDSIARFQQELAALGYRFQCVTGAGSAALSEPVSELARG